MSYSSSSMNQSEREKMMGKVINNLPEQDIKPKNIILKAKERAIQEAGQSYMENIADLNYAPLIKSKPAYGSIVNKPKGIFEPTKEMGRSTYGSRGIRRRFFNISFGILREIAKKVYPIGAIQNVRCMQLRPFCTVSQDDEHLGFRAKMVDPEATPSKKDKIEMRKMEEFFLYSGYTDFEGADEREEGLIQVLDLVTREMMTIDQVAISLRKNRKGELIDYWILDGASISKTIKGKGFLGDKSIAYVQELEGKVVETFTKDDLLFQFMNRRTDIRLRGWGYSYEEMCIDAITAWLFAMAYNKNFFDTAAQPKGILSFDGSDLNQGEIEELQRQWMSMFRGVKGMWKTPFLKGVKYQPLGPSNRDMEFNRYIQVLSSWICAIHGIDPAELGIKFAERTQGMTIEKPEAKIAYSKDRGLKDLLTFHTIWINKIKKMIPIWDPYRLAFTGMEAKNQQDELAVDKGQVETYMTLNEKRKEKDLKPIEDGDVVLNPQFIQLKQNADMARQQEAAQSEMGGGDEGYEDEEIEEEETPANGKKEKGKEDKVEKVEKEKPVEKEKIKKSIGDFELEDVMKKSKDNYIEIIAEL